MTMKKILFFLTTLFVFATYAQETSVEIDERLYSAFSVEELAEMAPEKIAFYNYYAEYGYVVQELPQEKYDAQDFPVIKVKDIETINIFELPEFKLGADMHTYFQYKIKGSTSELIVFSQEKS